MTKLLTRDAILGASDIKAEEVSVPEWGGTVRVRGLTAAQRDVFESKAIQMRGKDVNVNMAGVRAEIASMAIVDESDTPLFTSKDIKELGTKSGAALDRVFEAAIRLSGIGEEDVEELAKNSGADQSEDSPSD